MSAPELSPLEQSVVDRFDTAPSGICLVCEGHGWVLGREPQCSVWFLMRCVCTEVPR